MTDDSPSAPSRRRFLGTAAALGTTAVAGCTGSLLGTSGSNEIEPEEPSEPRNGTPGEFYTLVERNGIAVESLRWDESDLVLEYASNAATESESTKEIEIITTVFNENLVKNDAEVGMLYAEVANPFDGQVYGWGVKTEWCERYNAAVDAERERSGDDETDTDGDEESTDGTESDGSDAETDETESGASPADTAAMILMSNVLNTRVYAEDVED